MPSVSDVSKELLAIGAGAALATGVNLAIGDRLSPRARIGVIGAGLPAAAAVYPLTRSWRGADPGAVRREVIALAAADAVAAGAALLPAGPARTIAAAGWVAHAGFDYLHTQDHSSKLPGWYPPVCAGYDVVVAGLVASNAGR